MKMTFEIGRIVLSFVFHQEIFQLSIEKQVLSLLFMYIEKKQNNKLSISRLDSDFLNLFYYTFRYNARELTGLEVLVFTR